MIDYSQGVIDAIINGIGWTKRSLPSGIEIIDPQIVWRMPEAPKPSLDEQCEAAMARLKAHIDSRCAEHREAIRANSQWDIHRMHQRHDEWERALAARRMVDGVIRFHALGRYDLLFAFARIR